MWHYVFVFFNAAVAFCFLSKILSSDAQAASLSDRIPYAMIATYSFMTAAFQVGAWRPVVWYDFFTSIVTIMGAFYLVNELYERWWRRSD